MGALFPFSPLRGYVLGMREARERTSLTDAELNQMKQLFYEAMKAGAFGTSFNYNFEDRPEDGSWLPSHVASDEEHLALAEVMSEFGVGHLGHTIGEGLTQDQIDSKWNLVRQMIQVSGRPLHVAALGHDMRPLQKIREEGLPLILQMVANLGGSSFKLSEYNMYDYIPSWIDPLVGSAEERAAKLKNPETRAAMKQGAVDWNTNARTDWNKVKVQQVAHERNYKYEGMSIAEVAEAMGVHPVDAYIDLALDEDLETEFEIPPANTEEAFKKQEEMLLYPYAHISVSDGGAHTRFSSASTWPIYWLAFWIRDRQIMSLEEGHYKISAFPAWLADFKDRGILRVGNWADVIVYNQEEIGFAYERPKFANDFPGGERRLIQKANGLRYTIVNGTVTFEGNDCTGALPGKLLRSYDMVD